MVFMKNAKIIAANFGKYKDVVVCRDGIASASKKSFGDGVGVDSIWMAPEKKGSEMTNSISVSDGVSIGKTWMALEKRGSETTKGIGVSIGDGIRRERRIMAKFRTREQRVSFF